MKTVSRLVKIIETVMRVIVAVVAVVIILFAAYSIYDTFYINQHAFSSYELKQFKPTTPTEDDGNDYQDNFDKLKDANGDARGWITVKDSNIDYPIVQGRDDYEYAGKDVFGKTSITGAIYLKTDNSKDFSDPYNVIFGHHMDNGAMFGDLEKYKDEDYFNSHKNGWFYTGGRYFRLDVFAVMMTDAYDENVYDIDALSIRDRINYINANSKYIKPLSSSDRDALEQFEKNGLAVLDKLMDSGDPAMILALSTCESAITNGRIVVFCTATPIDHIEVPKEEPRIIERLTAIGHPFGSDSWGFLNVVCVLYCIFVVLPLSKSGIKFKQSRAAKRVRDLYNGYGYDGKDAMAIVDYGDNIKAKLKRYRTLLNVGTALEIAILAACLIAFFLTEDMTTPVVMCDKYTPLMIGISIIMFMVDVIFFVYRDIRILTPDEVAHMTKPEGNKNGS